jgi:hypothetical protein
MLRLLFIVEHTFFLPRHGIALFPGIVPVGEELFRVGSPILLKRPDGSEVQTSIAGMELPTPNPGGVFVPFFKELGKGDVPVGTEVWYSSGG